MIIIKNIAMKCSRKMGAVNGGDCEVKKKCFEDKRYYSKNYMLMRTTYRPFGAEGSRKGRIAGGNGFKNTRMAELYFTGGETVNL